MMNHFSNFALNFNLRRYITGNNPPGMEDAVDFDKLEWEGALTGAATVKLEPFFSALSIKATLPFKTADSKFTIDTTKVAAEAAVDFFFPNATFPKVHATGSLALTLPCPEEQGVPAMTGDVKLELAFDQLYVPDEISASFEYFCVGGNTTKIVVTAEIKNATFKLGGDNDTQLVEKLKLKMEAVQPDGPGASNGNGEFVFSFWGEVKTLVHNHYISLDFYFNGATGDIALAFRYEFENFDKTLKLTAVGNKAAGSSCAPAGNKLWVEISYDGGKEIKLDKLRGMGVYYNFSACETEHEVEARAGRALLAEGKGDLDNAAATNETVADNATSTEVEVAPRGVIPHNEHVVYEATFTLAELVVTNAGITVTDVVMTAVALSGAARDMSETEKMQWTFTFSGIFKLESAPSFSAEANVSFVLMRNPSDGAVEWESVDLSLAVENTLETTDGSARVTILAALEFSYPQTRITAAASVDAMVSGKHLSFDSTAEIYTPASTAKGEEGLVVRVTGQMDSSIEMSSFVSGALMTFSIEDLNFVLEGRLSELSITAGIDYSWSALPSFEELDVRGCFSGLATISKGGDDFSASAKIAAKIGFDKKVGYGLQTSIAVKVAFELDIDSPPFKVKLIGVVSTPCDVEGDSASGAFTMVGRCRLKPKTRTESNWFPAL